MKRKLVPAALHSELTEYSSLIRALRTSNTLDVTSHIAKAGPGRGGPEKELNSDDDDLDEDEVEEALRLNAGSQGEREYDTDTMTNMDFPPSTTYNSHDVSPSQTPGPSSPNDHLSRSGSQKRKRETSTSPLQPRKRDTWTRWPLLINDVHVPEWSFEDEIGFLASNALKLNPRPPLPSVDSEEHSEESGNDLCDLGDVDADSSFLPHLTNAASNHLSTILALLVAHTPNRSFGLQNRVEPMGWRAVLDVLSSCGDSRVADPKMINTVKSRMETLCGPSDESDKPTTDVLAAHRIQCSINAKEKLKAQISQPMEALFRFPAPPTGSAPTSQPRRCTRRKIQKPLPKSPAYIEEEEN
ncbi:hypothetical protein D9615_003276 [Tricholomella constricta]|uniref:Uncharacterized protein n=1 Tax=Tricholomella constricta TaxID=117010 RepID=A0A8H5HJ06_9AGAR|nr:hypothetical protein D9615_003276 [Tricholomella constricta]